MLSPALGREQEFRKEHRANRALEKARQTLRNEGKKVGVEIFRSLLFFIFRFCSPDLCSCRCAIRRRFSLLSHFNIRSEHLSARYLLIPIERRIERPV